MVEAILWDLGGVLVRTTDPSYREHWESRLGLSPGELSRLVTEGPLGWQAQLGQASVEQVWQSMGERFGLSEQELGQLQRDFWRGDQLNSRLLAYIRDNPAGLKMGLLSNAWPSLRRQLEQEWDIADHFDAILISAEIGIAKPDPHIYRAALQALQVVPERALFVDDMPQNVAGAQAVGMSALQFHSTDQVLEAIAAALGS